MKWMELLIVAGATLTAAVTVVVLYSLGVRLTAIAGDRQAAEQQGRALDGGHRHLHRERIRPRDTAAPAIGCGIPHPCNPQAAAAS